MFSLTVKERVDMGFFQRVLGWWKRINEHIEHGSGEKTRIIPLSIKVHDKS